MFPEETSTFKLCSANEIQNTQKQATSILKLCSTEEMYNAHETCFLRRQANTNCVQNEH